MKFKAEPIGYKAADGIRYETEEEAVEASKVFSLAGCLMRLHKYPDSRSAKEQAKLLLSLHDKRVLSIKWGVIERLLNGLSSDYLLCEDECALDAFEFFEKGFNDITGHDIPYFKELSSYSESNDGLHMEWEYAGFVLEYDGDDPFHKLRALIKDREYKLQASTKDRGDKSDEECCRNCVFWINEGVDGSLSTVRMVCGCVRSTFRGHERSASGLCTCFDRDE